MSTNPQNQNQNQEASGSITAGQIRTYAAAIAGAVAVKFGLDASWVPLIGAVLTVAGMGVWSYLEKRGAGKQVKELNQQISDAKVAIGTALALPSGTTVTTLARTLEQGPIAPAVQYIPMVNTSPTSSVSAK
jgi:hypothetical protein